MTIDDFIAQWNSPEPTLIVHTSGSTGKPKELLVEKERMLASARITCDFLGLKAGDTALLCMPLDYIAGKMMVVRSLERGLRLVSVHPSNHPLADVDEPLNFAAMVPSQVFESLKVSAERERLCRIGNLIIGGGSVPAAMEQELRGFPNAVWSTYGMTETLSHVALRRISGGEASLWYTPLDGVGISVAESEDTDGRVGRLLISAPHVCADVLLTNDIVELHPVDAARGDVSPRFRVIGRTDNVICSGGIKLHIEELEELLRPHLRARFCISKIPDAKFGEVAVLVLQKDSLQMSLDEVSECCRKILTPYQRPKSVIVVSAIPLTETGKINRAAVYKLLIE